MPRRSFVWRGRSYRFDSSTWLFWGGARLILLPGKDSEYRMTPDDRLFIDFARQAGYESPNDAEVPDPITDCQTYLQQHGYRIWSAHDAVQVVRDDADEELATRLLNRLIHWYFIIEF